MQRACRYGTVGSFIICGVFLDVYWFACSFICLSICGYGTTDIKITQLRGLGSSVGCVSVCVFIC